MDVFAVGLSGIVLHYDGRSWTRMQSGAREYLRGVWGPSARATLVVGDNIIYHRYGMR